MLCLFCIYYNLLTIVTVTRFLFIYFLLFFCLNNGALFVHAKFITYCEPLINGSDLFIHAVRCRVIYKCSSHTAKRRKKKIKRRSREISYPIYLYTSIILLLLFVYMYMYTRYKPVQTSIICLLFFS